MKLRTIIVAVALLTAAASAHGQDRTLERVQNLIATGRLTEARNTLAEWQREHSDPDKASADDRARALFLGGLLTTDAKAAEDAFLSVALGYPSSPVAPEALLRLGQSLYTAGETERAITYLERLRYDYPAAPERETGMLWLTRAQLAIGRAAAACGTARESLLGTTNRNVRTLIELERDRACAESGGVAENAAAAPVTRTLPNLEVAVDPVPGAARAVDTTTAKTPATQVPPVHNEPAPVTRADAMPPVETRLTDAATAPEYAVQTAAFSQRRAAETIAAELRAKGFDARIVTVPGSPYFRVRCGAFASSREAAAAALRIRDAGFATLIVNDVRLERRL